MDKDDLLEGGSQSTVFPFGWIAFIIFTEK